MKKLKLTLSILCVIAFTISACRKDKTPGPQGDTGSTGATGATGTLAPPISITYNAAWSGSQNALMSLVANNTGTLSSTDVAASYLFGITDNTPAGEFKCNIEWEQQF